MRLKMKDLALAGVAVRLEELDRQREALLSMRTELQRPRKRTRKDWPTAAPRHGKVLITREQIKRTSALLAAKKHGSPRTPAQKAHLSRTMKALWRKRKAEAKAAEA